MKFGVLLPHFGKEASPSRLIEGSRMCEELGFERCILPRSNSAQLSGIRHPELLGVSSLAECWKLLF